MQVFLLAVLGQRRLPNEFMHDAAGNVHGQLVVGQVVRDELRVGRAAQGGVLRRQAQRVELHDDALEAPLHVAHAALAARVAVDDVANGVVAEDNVLGRKLDVAQNFRHEVLLRNGDFGLARKFVRANDVDAVLEDGVEFFFVVEAENKERLGKVQRNARKVLVLDDVVLRVIHQVRQHANDFLAVFGLRHLVEFVHENNRVHALRVHQNARQAAPHGPFVSVAVALEVRRVGRAAQRQHAKGPP